MGSNQIQFDKKLQLIPDGFLLLGYYNPKIIFLFITTTQLIADHDFLKVSLHKQITQIPCNQQSIKEDKLNKQTDMYPGDLNHPAQSPGGCFLQCVILPSEYIVDTNSSMV